MAAFFPPGLLKSILECDPSYPVQFVCLAVATIVMELVIKVIEKLVVVVLNRLYRIKDNLLQEMIGNLKNEEFYPFFISMFNEWCEKQGKKDHIIDPAEGSLSDESVDKYMSTGINRKLWTDFAVKSEANMNAVNIQHSFSGALAMFALTRDNEVAFLTFARWAVFLEVGFEASDMIKIILIPLASGSFEFSKVFIQILHHIALYLFLPINRILLPSSIGRDVAACFVAFAGIGAPCIILGWAKNNANISTPFGKFVIIVSQGLITLSMFLSRGPYWCYLAQKIMLTLWRENTSQALLLGVALACVLFSFFNIFVCFFLYKGLCNTIKRLKNKNMSTLVEKATEPNVGHRRSLLKRTSIVIDELAQEVNIGRRSVRRSISIMGVDYDLEEKEVHVLKRRSIVRRTSSIFAASDLFGKEESEKKIN